MSDKPNLKHNYGTIDKDYGVFLATRPEAEDGPIYMVNLMKYHEVAQYSDDAAPSSKPISGREADDRYNPASILSRIGATIVFAGDVVGNADGPEDWDRIAIVRYPTRKSFIDMQSRKDFGEKHVHKAAGMKRTIIVCCRPEDLSLDYRERPTQTDQWLTMVVRRDTDLKTAFAAIPNATNFSAEGTIIGDGRKWSTVQFANATSPDDYNKIVASLAPQVASGDAYVIGVRASLNAITQ
ncbi:MAG: hypothetical protein ACKO82_05790 [Acidimicrobiaceae bacterium]